MLNIGVLVSGGGSNLQALIDARDAGKLFNGELALVVSSVPGAGALIRAEKANIKTIIIDKSIAGKNFDKQLHDTLVTEKIDLVVLAGFLCIIGKLVLTTFKNKIINVHPSLIPSFCGKGFYGLKVHEEVLKYGVKITGATVHFVNEEIDGGKIIMQKAVEVLDNDTPETLQLRVMREAEWVILPQAVAKLCEEGSTNDANELE